MSQCGWLYRIMVSFSLDMNNCIKNISDIFCAFRSFFEIYGLYGYMDTLFKFDQILVTDNTGRRNTYSNLKIDCKCYYGGSACFVLHTSM